MAATSIAERLHKVATDAVHMEIGVSDGTMDPAQLDYLLQDLASQILEVITLNARLDARYTVLGQLRGEAR